MRKKYFFYFVESSNKYLKEHVDGPKRKRATGFLKAIHTLAKFKINKLNHPNFFAKTKTRKINQNVPIQNKAKKDPKEKKRV